jgi:phage tail-like protein
VSENGNRNFRFLNLDGLWPVFKWEGLQLNDDGSLQLQTVPLLEGAELFADADINTEYGPAGIAVSNEGTIYFTNPKTHQVLRVDPCDGSISRVSCMGGEGRAAGQFNTPRGLLIPKYRDSLFVADSGNHRIQIFDPDSGQLVDMWGDSAADNGPSDQPGRFNTPWTLAGDDQGNVYVVDYGNKRVQKFDRTGELAPSFGKAIEDCHMLQQPVDIAVHSSAEGVRVYIVDANLHAVLIFDDEGKPVHTPENPQGSFGADVLIKPMGIAVSNDAVYVGDNERHAILKFKRGKSYRFIGDAIGYHAPVAALLMLDDETLLVHNGESVAPRRLSVRKGYRTTGAMWSSAISGDNLKTSWHRVEVEMRKLSGGAHLRLFVFTADNESDKPAVDPSADNPFSDPKWRRAITPTDRFANLSDVFIGGEPSRFVWIGALFLGDGRSTPVISQIRVEFDHKGYLNHLPAIYRTDSSCADFLLRFLSMFETLFDDVEEQIVDLSVLFDPESTPKDILPWLAGWLAVELNEEWDEERKRETIARAFEFYGRRGTAAGLREALRIFGGVNAIIEEPVMNAAWWSLPAEADPCGCGKKSKESSCGCGGSSKGKSSCGCGAGAKGCSCGGRSSRQEPVWQATENSILGVTTMLLSASPQGAVLGSSATLDHSHLITNEEFGAPLFSEVAHQFNVQIYRTQLHCPETLPRVQAIIEREKPAHTEYHLCVIEPRMRVGFQARVGKDAVVAGPPSQLLLHEGMFLDQQSSLGGEPSGTVGEHSRVGVSTRVG